MSWLPWLPLVAVALHILEEFVWPGGFLPWYRAYRPAITVSVTPRFAVIVNALLLAVAALTGALGLTPQGIVLWLVIAALVGLNGLWHAYATWRGRRYSPGVITGVLLYLPLAIGGYAFFLQTRQVSPANAALAAAQGAAYWLFSEGRKALRARATA